MSWPVFGSRVLLYIYVLCHVPTTTRAFSKELVHVRTCSGPKYVAAASFQHCKILNVSLLVVRQKPPYHLPLSNFVMPYQQPSGLDQVWSRAFGDAWVHGRQSKDSANTGIRQHHPFRGAVCSASTRTQLLLRYPRRASQP